MKQTILCIIIFFNIINSQTIESLIPSENSVQGWEYENDSSCVEGIAKKENDLLNIIDGGAVLYFSLGFKEAAFKGYTDQNSILCVSLFNQTSKENALSVYEEFNIGFNNCKIKGLMNTLTEY